MEDWISNGVALGWLIDANARKVWIYSRDEVKELREPATIHGTGLMAGFDLPMESIYRGLKRR